MQIFNNLSKKLETFTYDETNPITIYSCGPTVYDHSHIGHARSAISWDTLYRYLNFKGLSVYWMRNITNIDDKIINRASELGINPDQLSREYTLEFWKDMQALHVSWPDDEPRATDYIKEMIKFIEELIAKGHAYEVNGDVYFKVKTHENYGQLKGLSLDELSDGVQRIETNDLKADPLDFALWKSFPNDRLTSFESPWGLGRPGWHLECSTMIQSILAAKFKTVTLDIHAGGDDLIFPHHENECAQSECLSGEPLARYWMHNGMIMINGKKMSKSLNNFLTIKDLLAKYSANGIKYFCLSSHYKKQLNFTHEALAAADQGINKLLNSLTKTIQESSIDTNLLNDILNTKSIKVLQDIPSIENEFDLILVKEFESAMDEDINTAKALSIIFKSASTGDLQTKTALACLYMLKVLGFSIKTVSENGSLPKKSVSNDKSNQALETCMELILELRSSARQAKDFNTSDLIRDKLTSAGISIKDFRDQPSAWELN